MRNKTIAAAICLLLTLTLTGTALAAGSGDSGFYGIGTAPGLTVEPLTPEGDPAAAETRDADGDGLEDVFYPGSTALRVTLTDTAADSTYLILLSERDGDRVFYVDQARGGGVLAFTVSFVLPDSQTALLLTVSSSQADFAPLTVPLAYTPAAQSGSTPEEEPPVEEPSAEELPAEESPAEESPAEEPPAEQPPEEQSPEEKHPEEQQPPSWQTCVGDEGCPMYAFTDLNTRAWYHDGIHFVLEKGIMNGYDGGIFAPGSATSRAMLVTMLWRMEGKPTGGDAVFADVPDGVWYAEAVGWAASVQLTAGYGDGRFGPDDPVTREQLATILYRYIRSTGGGFTEAWSYEPDFSDFDRVADWAYEAVCWMTMNGILQGSENHLLLPQETATRAQVATILMRLSEQKQQSHP
jgi:hypothetical protein